MAEKSTILSFQTLIPIGGVVSLLAAAFSLGVLTTKVQNVSEQMVETRQDLSALSNKVDRLIELKITRVP